MVKIHFLGTCSGTEPMPGMHHCSLVLEVNGALYWFDAGENCAHTAYTSGIDVMKTEALFVSHPHIDHVGGLANLFSCMNKLNNRYGQTLPNDNTLEVFFPDAALLAAIRTVAVGSVSGRMRFQLNEHGLRDGVIFEDRHLRVTACHNQHLRESGENGWHSFSFLLEAEGRRIVFSGDVREPCELDGLIGDGVDVLIMETGHHKVIDVCCYASSRGVGKLRFNHHGREIIEGRAEAEALVAAYAEEHGFSIRICHDGMTEEL